MSKILITGALGRLGTVLTRTLRAQHGTHKVIAIDILAAPADYPSGPVKQLSVLDRTALFSLIQTEQVTEVYHLAGEVPGGKDMTLPKLWQNNLCGLLHILDAAKIYGFKLFYAGSISVFGYYVQRINCPQHGVMQPTSVYGISKAAAEDWCRYYHETYGIDVRSIRMPVIASPDFKPRGGTLDYLTEIFKAAKTQEHYTCHLRSQTVSPVIYIDDAIRAIKLIMSASSTDIHIRTAYNIQAISFSPGDIVARLQLHYPKFKVKYSPDHRQDIVGTWPITLDDSHAIADWGWHATCNMELFMTKMLSVI